jgi:hypothetical protein
LPAGAITSIVRAPDGVLWVAARDGLARLDGDRFVTVGAEAGLRAARARARCCSTAAGGSGWRCRAATYSRADMQSPFLPVWPQGDFSGLTLAPDGTVWASDADSYYRMLPSAPAADAAARPALSGSNMHYDRDGAMWLFRPAGWNGAAPARAGGAPQQQDLNGGLPQSFSRTAKAMCGSAPRPA